MRARLLINERPDVVLFVAAELDVMGLCFLCIFGRAAFCLMGVIKPVLNIVTALENFGFNPLRIVCRFGAFCFGKKFIGNQFQRSYEFFIDGACLALAMTVIGKSRLVHIKEAEQKNDFLIGGGAGDRAKSHDQKESQCNTDDVSFCLRMIIVRANAGNSELFR